MKKHTLMTAFLTCLCLTAFARIWRVNNNAGVNADFTTLAPAIAAAADDDIIYVEPSATSYDEDATVVINKRLKIIGNGSFLSSHPGLQVNSNDSKFTNTSFSFVTGSEGSSICGIWIMGLTIFPNVNNITIQRCRIDASGIYVILDHSNISILENWVSGNIGSVGTGAVTNFLIRNNIVKGYMDIKTNDVATIENNTIGSGTYISLNLNGNTTTAVFNNILSGSAGSPAVIGGAGGTFSNNICSDNSIPNTNSNQLNVDLTTVLVAFPFNSDNDAKLKVGSPAINVGLFGTGDDIGAFNDGTNRPTFIVGLIPPYPTVYALSGANVVTMPTMTVTISTRSNQ
jgi:hypothetical protein